MNDPQDLEGDGQRTAALSKELSDFLLELSIAVHRSAMYPGDHPALLEAGDKLLASLSRLLERRTQVAIGVAQSQLVIEGVATEAGHPVLGDLARRLHAQQLGAVTFARGAESDEVLALLHLLARDSQREGEPLGLLPADELPRWPHVRVYPLGYERLEFREDQDARGEAPDRATHLWLGLAQAAMPPDETLDPAAPPDAEKVAQSIQAHRREAAYDQVIVGYLLQLAEELKGEGAESSVVRDRVSALIRALDPQTLARIVEMGGSGAQRQRFLLDASQSLAVDSVMKIVRAAATASQKDISSSLTRLLTKLSQHAEAGAPRVRDQADLALRQNVEGLLQDWRLEDRTPDRYSLMLDTMARAAPVFRKAAGEGGPAGAQRLLQMSLELDAWGPDGAEALETLLEAREIRFLLTVTDGASAGNQAAATIRERLTRPEQLRALLEGGEIDEGTLGDLVGRMGDPALPVLLDVLADSESAPLQRKVLDVLGKQPGAALGALIAQRLPDERWPVVRNLLALLQKVPDLPAGFSPEPYLAHAEVQVRREAFPLALREPKLRATALVKGLSDADDKIVRLSLSALQRGGGHADLGSVAGPVWVRVRAVLRESRDAEAKFLAVKALEGSASPEAREGLIELVSPGKTLLGKPKLANPGPEVVAALRALARSWGSDPLVARILAQARKSKDPGVRAAATTTATKS